MSGTVSARLWMAYLAAVVSLTGIQLILPMVPAMQAQLGLTDAEISIVYSAYLLPSAALAFPLGILGDRVGRKLLYTVAMALFGLGGLAQLIHPSFAVIVLTRVVQGTAVAALLPLSVTLIGDELRGREQVVAQARRTISMTVGNVILPLVGALLLGLAWFAPFAGQVVALPLAVAGWFVVPRGELAGVSSSGSVRRLLALRGEGSLRSLLLMGTSRFWVKHAFLAYLPLLLARQGTTAGGVGLVLALTAASGTLAALAVGRLVRVARPSLLLSAGLGAAAAAMAVIGTASGFPATLFACLCYGAGDGVSGVVESSMSTQAVPGELRSSFVSATGTAKNLGKFLGPTAVGLLVLAVPLGTAFLSLGVVALGAVALVPPLRALDDHLTGPGRPGLDPLSVA